MSYPQIHVYLLGAPGAGKGTQAQRLSEWLAIPQISTSDMLREVRSQGGELGRQIQEIMNTGKLVPDSIVVELVRERLSKPDCSQGAIFDGFPRTDIQARSLDELLLVYHRAPLRAIMIDVPVVELKRRLLGRLTCSLCNRSYHETEYPPKQQGICDVCGSALVVRPDDKPETVTKRLDVYFEQTAPLIQYYKNRNALLVVDGTKKIEQVFQDIVYCLDRTFI